eukprot:m.80314 g.80314  ORF g.80314 m.80314 type:complete len:529 (+) comp25302_c0_seq1:167-1753(+)
MGGFNSKFDSDVLLLSGSWDTTIRLWNVETGQCKHILRGHTHRVNDVAFSPDGEQFASVSRDESVRLWQADGTLIKQLDGHKGDVTAVEYCPTGHLLASACATGAVRLWSLDGTLKHVLKGHTDKVNAICFNQAGTRLVSGGNDLSIRVWDLANGKCKFLIRNLGSWVNAVAWCPKNKMIAVGETNTCVKLFDPKRGNFIAELTKSYTCALCFSPKGEMLAAGNKMMVNIWEPGGRVLAQTLEGHTGDVTSVCFNATGTALASASVDKTIRVYDTLTATCTSVFKAHAEQVSSIKWFLKEENSLDAAANDDGVVGVVGEQDNPLQRTYSTRQFKVLVVGDVGTGKTSIIRQTCDGYFSDKYKATIGVDFAVKKVSLSDGYTTRLALWDIAGQERFGNLTRVYYKGAAAAFVVADVSKISSLNSAKIWKADIDAKVMLPNRKHIPVVLLVNKSDIEHACDDFSESKLDKYCKENKFVAWLYTSAKTNANINEASALIVEHIIESNDPYEKGGPQGFKVGVESEAQTACC